MNSNPANRNPSIGSDSDALAAERKHPAQVLVVDDEPEMQRLIRQCFRKNIRAREFDFSFAQNGVEALNKIREGYEVDVILTDIRMPEMDGLTLLNELSQINDAVKAVVISAYGDLANIRTAMNRGAFDFLIKPIDFNDLELTIKKTLKFVQQIRERQQKLAAAIAQLEHNAMHDELTGLPNRIYLKSLLQQNISRTQRRPGYLYAVLFIDLDRFKVVNDSLGHSVGDRLLKEVAERLKVCIRTSDTVARFGGDEFVVLLEDLTSVHDVLHITRRIQEQLATPFQLNGHQAHLGGSIGIALSTIQYQDAEAILRDADAAMYRAKAKGTNQYVIFDPTIQASAMERLHLENHLRQAIDQGEFSLYYQPIIEVSTGRLSSFEALIRWFTPEGSVSPIRFIPIAEETGLINPLGWWVFQEACYQLQQWQHNFPQQPSLTLNVNLSPIQLNQENFIENMKATLDAIGLPGNHFKLEITESCLLDNSETQITRLKQLKDLGLKICVDDFGTGYSSLSRLHEFPIDTLKIDRAFMKRMETGSGGLEMVKMIVALGHSLNMDVVAEGVETESQLQYLRTLDCEFAQGYFFARPLNQIEAEEFIRRNLS